MPRPPKAKTAAKDSTGNFAWGQHSTRHLAPQTARRDSAILQSEAIPQVVSEAKNNMVALPGQLFYSTQKFSLN